MKLLWFLWSGGLSDVCQCYAIPLYNTKNNTSKLFFVLCFCSAVPIWHTNLGLAESASSRTGDESVTRPPACLSSQSAHPPAISLRMCQTPIRRSLKFHINEGSEESAIRTLTQTWRNCNLSLSWISPRNAEFSTCIVSLAPVKDLKYSYISDYCQFSVPCLQHINMTERLFLRGSTVPCGLRNDSESSRQSTVTFLHNRWPKSSSWINPSNNKKCDRSLVNSDCTPQR